MGLELHLKNYKKDIGQKCYKLKVDSDVRHGDNNMKISDQDFFFLGSIEIYPCPA